MLEVEGNGSDLCSLGLCGRRRGNWGRCTMSWHWWLVCCFCWWSSIGIGNCSLSLAVHLLYPGLLHNLILPCSLALSLILLEHGFPDVETRHDTDAGGDNHWDIAVEAHSCMCTCIRE
ncbi:MAG: hypothetical protein J3R72DRAFT_438365 [Linnemannia gamsii]|nr:MAG: hypothetical protein J3R72DRAFT_438365 [Linnemannia gamsii]